MMIEEMKNMNGTSNRARMPNKKRIREWPKTHCPNCDSVISINQPREGVIVTCPACGVELEIVRIDPFVVDFTEDWQEELEE